MITEGPFHRPKPRNLRMTGERMKASNVAITSGKRISRPICKNAMIAAATMKALARALRLRFGGEGNLTTGRKVIDVPSVWHSGQREFRSIAQGGRRAETERCCPRSDAAASGACPARFRTIASDKSPVLDGFRRRYIPSRRDHTSTIRRRHKPRASAVRRQACGHSGCDSAFDARASSVVTVTRELPRRTPSEYT